MNKIEAEVCEVVTADKITKIEGRFEDNKIKAVTLEPPYGINKGERAFFVFKETEVGLAKNFSGEISLSNRFRGELVSLSFGKILTRACVKVGSFEITSIITTEAAERLDLSIGDEVAALVKATEVSLEIKNG